MEEYTLHLSEFQKQKIETYLDSKQKCKVPVIHTKVNEQETV